MLASGELTPEEADRQLASLERQPQAAASTPTGGDSVFDGATRYRPAGEGPAAPQVGDHVSHFELVEFLGEGGMGTVWKAKDLESERFVVVKFILGQLRGSTTALKLAKESFQAAHQLRHPALCAMIDFINDPRLGPCALMDYVPGMTLTKYRRAYAARHGDFTVKLVYKVLKPIAEALDDAHRRNVIHRDVKPDNILVVLDERGRLADVKLIDLGVAATVQSTLSQVSVAAENVDVVGTPLYWAPEQCRGHHPTAQTDQYALAAVAYELLSGHPPFAAPSRVQLIQCIKDEFPEPASACSEAVNQVLLKGMAKKRDERFGSCVEFVERLWKATQQAATPTSLTTGRDSILSLDPDDEVQFQEDPAPRRSASQSGSKPPNRPSDGGRKPGQEMIAASNATPTADPGDSIANSPRRPCPMCGESVAASAALCRFCGASFTVTPGTLPVAARPVSTFAAAAEPRVPGRIYPSDPPKNPALMAVMSCLCIVGLGQMTLGQTGKGLLLLFGSIGLAVVTAGLSVVVTLPLAAVDAYLIAKKLEAGNSVGEWEWF